MAAKLKADKKKNKTRNSKIDLWVDVDAGTEHNQKKLTGRTQH